MISEECLRNLVLDNKKIKRKEEIQEIKKENWIEKEKESIEKEKKQIIEMKNQIKKAKQKFEEEKKIWKNKHVNK